MTGVQVLLAAALVLGSGVAATTLWFFSNRYVGELAALPPATPGGRGRLRFSVLDFWGNRLVRLPVAGACCCKGAARSTSATAGVSEGCWAAGIWVAARACASACSTFWGYRLVSLPVAGAHHHKGAA